MPPAPTTVALEEYQPSQRYIDADRLESVVCWFDFHEPSLEALPVVPGAARLPTDRLVLTDGHTRALVAYLAGWETVFVVEDADWPNLDAATYRTCVAWCLEEDVTAVGDLVGRVVARETFEAQWVDRCRAHGSSG